MSKKYLLFALILFIPFFLIAVSYFTDVAQLCSDEFVASQPQDSPRPCHGENVVENRGFLDFYNEKEGFMGGKFVLGYGLLLLPSAIIVLIGNFIISKVGNKSQRS
ncbi:hypothetical protein KY385_00905 [Candidatus Parcubacteria bacterium]|nr:hypothetical protein [Candidatus Parcubacteria bacterium]